MRNGGGDWHVRVRGIHPDMYIGIGTLILIIILVILLT
jgi:hypothetical protein